MVSKTLLLSAALSLWAQTGLATSCRSFFIPVDIDFPYLPLPTNLTDKNITSDYIQSIYNMTAERSSATYQIGATFCEPTNNNASRHNTLQILQHGIQYNRTYWSALGFANLPQNNFVEFASNEGFPTLAIDRLCNGASSKPNGLLVCQAFAEAEVLHQLVLKARAGTLPLGTSSRQFSTIIGVSHSLGSSVTKLALAKYPNDLDATVLTGFSTRFILGIAGLALYGKLTPAAAYKPRFANLDRAYYVIGVESGYDYINYFGNYDTALSVADFNAAGTFTLGEALTANFAQFPTPQYKNPVFLSDGQNDPFYCQQNATSVFDFNNRGNCAANVPTEVRNSFSNVPASKYSYHVESNTGHAENLHRTAPSTFSAIFNFLDAQGF